MISCCYVSSDCSMIGEREFDTVGQRASFSEQGFKEAILGNAAFIPEEDFKRIGFSAEELAAHGPSGLRIDPPASFLGKLSLAQQVFRDIQSRVSQEGQGPQVLAEIGDIKGE